MVFHVLVHAFAHPELANEALCFQSFAGRGEGLGQHNGALGCFRPAAAKSGEHLGCRWIFAVKRLFGIGAQRRRTRPPRQFALGCSDFGGRHVLLPGNGNRPGKNMPVETACLHGVAKGDGACRVAAGKRIQSGFKLARIVRPVKAWYGAGNFGRGRHEGGKSRRIRLHIGKRHGSFRHGAGQRVPNGRGKTCRHQSPNCLFHTALHHWTETIDLLVLTFHCSGIAKCASALHL